MCVHVRQRARSKGVRGRRRDGDGDERDTFVSKAMVERMANSKKQENKRDPTDSCWGRASPVLRRSQAGARGPRQLRRFNFRDAMMRTAPMV